jgi:Asp-tRNA(Asn)/Glu-tRNA(Gln) amidotransferase A subunit family amidase
LCGIRPTAGLVSGSGIVPYSHTQDTAGPITRTIEDAVRVLDVIANRNGQNSKDDESVFPDNQISLEAPVGSYLDFLKADGLKGKRIGVLHSFFGKVEINQPVNEIMNAALAVIRDAGAVIVSLDDNIDSTWLVKDVSVHLHELNPHLGKYLSSFKDKAPVHSLEDILADKKYIPGIEWNLMIANKLNTSTPDYRKRIEMRKELGSKLADIFEKNKLDAIIYPHQQQLVCKVQGSQQQRNGVLAAVTGFPAFVVPGGFTRPDETAPIGVPAGLEILGRPFEEGKLIEIAYGFEQSSKVRRAPVL